MAITNGSMYQLGQLSPFDGQLAQGSNNIGQLLGMQQQQQLQQSQQEMYRQLLLSERNIYMQPDLQDVYQGTAKSLSTVPKKETLTNEAWLNDRIKTISVHL